MINQPTTKIIYMEKTLKLINQKDPVRVGNLMKSGNVKTAEDSLHYLVIN